MIMALRFLAVFILMFSVAEICSVHHHSENAECGGRITNAKFGNLSSPNYPNDYPNNASCRWLLHVPEGRRLFLAVSFDIVQSEMWCADYLLVYGGNHEEFIAATCGKGYLEMSAPSNYLVIEFVSDGENTSSGFNIEYFDIPMLDIRNAYDGTAAGSFDCGGLYFGESGQLSSPNYPELYNNSLYCTYNITVPEGGIVYLNFTDLDLEPSESCQYDYVRVFDGYQQQELAMACGQMALSVEGISNSVYVTFVTDESEQHRGWSLTWSRRVCSETLEKPSGYLTSPGYPAVYPNGYRCSKTIKVREGRVGIFMNLLSVESALNCGYDYLAVYDSVSGKELGKHCGEGERYVSGLASSVDVLFKTDNSVQGHGWTLNWTTVTCGHELTGKEGTLTSPNYKDSFVCSWKIDVVEESVVLELFEIDNSWSCEDNSLAFYDGKDGVLIGTLCESHQRKFMAYSSSVFVVFTSRGEKGVKWALKWSQQKLPSTTALPTVSPSTSHAYTDCGMDRVAPEGNLFSPEYPGQYPNNAFCTWNISVPNVNETIHIDVVWLNIEYHFNCSYDYLRFVDTDSGVTIAKLCGHTSTVVKGLSNSISIVFKTDESIAASGWELQWKESGAGVAERSTTEPPFCGGHYGEESGVLYSPNYPEHYPDSIRCVWTIEVPADMRIEVYVTDFHVELEHNSCIYDSLQFHDGVTNRLIGTYCGNRQFTVQSTSSMLKITFDTDGTEQLRGWSLYWKAREIVKPVAPPASAAPVGAAF